MQCGWFENFSNRLLTLHFGNLNEILVIPVTIFVIHKSLLIISL